MGCFAPSLHTDKRVDWRATLPPTRSILIDGSQRLNDRQQRLAYLTCSTPTRMTPVFSAHPSRNSNARTRARCLGGQSSTRCDVLSRIHCRTWRTASVVVPDTFHSWLIRRRNSTRSQCWTKCAHEAHCIVPKESLRLMQQKIQADSQMRPETATLIWPSYHRRLPHWLQLI